MSGEVRGAPRGRDLVSEPRQDPTIFQLQAGQSPLPNSELQRRARKDSKTNSESNGTTPATIQASPGGQRQANPDIQDIITGIVKLLKGNVIVNAVHHRPEQIPARINNRGPPRISEAQLLPLDLISPVINPPPLPTYEQPPAPHKPSINQLPPNPPGRPFVNGIPIPEQIVPQRPWNRPNRPGGITRRPHVPHKPSPSSEKPHFDFKKPLEQPPENQLENAFNITDISSEETINSSPTPESPKTTQKSYLAPLKTDNGLQDDILVLGTNSQILKKNDSSKVRPTKVQGLDPTSTKINATSVETTSKTLFQTTLRIETSSIVNIIESSSTVLPLEGMFQGTFHSSFDLEPSSKADVLETQTSSDTPTKVLPTTFHKPDATVLNGQQVTSSVTFTRGQETDRYHYRPRPGIVLDDTLDYTGVQNLQTHRPYPPVRHGETFDIVVSAVHGPGASHSNDTVKIPNNIGSSDVILTSAVEGQGFVSIDGKRTFINLFDTTERLSPTKNQIQPTRIPNTGYAVAQTDINHGIASPANVPPRKPFTRRPTQPPVRIDTCIVGDTSTCDASQHEACATVQGVSACHCKPGFARLQHSLPCKRVVSIVVSLRVDKIYENRVVWDKEYGEKESERYQTLAYEAVRAVESAMSMTPFSDEYVSSLINNIYQGDVSQGQGGVYVNATLKLSFEQRTARPSLAGELQKHLLGVIHRRNNNIGSSALYVDSPPGSISSLQDLDECASSELNDCHSSATCANSWGGFTCACKQGFKDPQKNDPSNAGRSCLSCPSSHCNNRGTCSYQNDQMQCSCIGNYYGNQCELDGEVLGVAIGASVVALIIIVLTLVCLTMWTRKWSREQKFIGSPVYGYMQGGYPGTLPATLARVGGSVGTITSKQGPPPSMTPYIYPHMTDHTTPANVYATEPMGPTRPSSAMFSYPTLGVQSTLPPIPLPRLQTVQRGKRIIQPHHHFEPDSSDSEPQDKDRADLIPQSNALHVPRPKSRISLANQSGIYYDVEYDQGDSHHLSKNNIPMSTYTMARPYYRT